MNLKLPLLVFVTFFAVASVSAEAGNNSPTPQRRVMRDPSAQPEVARYSLNFPGGTPRELSAAVAQASGKPCNLIVAPKFENMKLPAIRLENVTTSELFTALRESSHVTEWGSQGQTVNTIRYNFITMSSPVTDESIWFLFTGGLMPDSKQEQPVVCRVYSLAMYLNDYSVDDVTTALTTAWNLQGAEPPKLAFHKETSLLIVVGDPVQQDSVNQVLSSLSLNLGGTGSNQRVRKVLEPDGTPKVPASK
ncbi:MAG: hypothetical protein K0R17_1761 [Rariglobus sp.]|jgi:hypothetical protein|nr:hypothetical protein [Rariglobus sp.]